MKRVKMCLYGNPGTGKSVFACMSPKPFFITTDGNYEWLDEFGAKPEDHAQVESWNDAKKVFESNFDGYDTIVVDLVEDLFKWCESEFCVKNKVSHIGDLGFGKGYDLTRNEFFIEICKLFNKDKNVILISHGVTLIEKDRRGVEHTKYAPSSRIPDKVWDMIEGRTRYFLRCYLKAEEIGEEEKTVIKKRYLSFIPKENEFGVCRGINESIVPQDIPLEWKVFADLIGLNSSTVSKEEPKKEIIQTIPVKEEYVDERATSSNIVINKEPISPIEELKVEVNPQDKVAAIKAKIAQKSQEDQPKTILTPVNEVKETVLSDKSEIPFEPDPITEQPKPIEQSKTMSNADKIAAIKAKIAAQKAAMNK